MMEQVLEYLTSQWTALGAFLAFDTNRLGDTDVIVRLVLQGLLLLGSAFFSGSETALFSLSRLDLQKLRRERNSHSETLHALLDQPRRLIISVLCGNELINIASSANMVGLLVSLYGIERAGVISVFVMVPLLLLVGEVTPKTIAVSNPVGVSTRMVASPMSVWVRLAMPIVWVIRGASDFVTTLFVGEQKSAENILQVDEFRSLVEAGEEEGELKATERALIYNLLEAGDTEVVEIMTPRTRVAFLNVEMGVPEMVTRIQAYQHPRVPVFRGHRDNLVGFVHAEDILSLLVDEADLNALAPEDIMHPPVVVPLTKNVDEMFDFFQTNQARAAAVLNEFGGVEGFLTMKDVLTFIFGEISGEIRGQELYQERDENYYDLPGDMKLNDFNTLTNFGIEDPRMTTIGGVAFRHLDRLPQVGDKVTVESIEITITDMDGHRISGVRVARGVTAEEAAEEAEEAAVEAAGETTESAVEKVKGAKGVDEAPMEAVSEDASPRESANSADAVLDEAGVK
jgi:CBS domain containing-hemolysin-like protein